MESDMRVDEIRKHVERLPFRAFRLHMSDGTVHVVSDPDLVLVTRHTVIVGVRRAGEVIPDDAHYYDRRGTRPLPVLRVRFDDPQQTWLYLDPGRGAIVLKEERLTRLNRWLYHGLHSLDFPFLYAKRPLWDIVVILLSVGGIVLSVTTVSQSWRRLRRHARRFDRPGLTS